MNVKSLKAKRILSIAVAALSLGVVEQAAAAAVIFNTGDSATATVALGINDFGHLNTAVGNVAANASATGLAGKIGGDFVDATSPGCLCEGWGIAVNGTTSGYANESAGSAGLVLDSFTSTSSTATSAVHLTSLPGLEVTHQYMPSASGDLFEAKVTISNTTLAAVNNVTYRRVMDWDVPPTEFREYVTIGGTATTTLLKGSGDNGFASSNPLAADSLTISCPLTTDFVDCGASDHGAIFDFDFGTLASGESYTFSTFYGASTSEAAAFAALGAVGAELFSFGQSDGGEVSGEPLTFIFAFSGVGGTAVIPGPTGSVPLPGTIALFSAGLLGLRMSRRKG